MSFNAKPRQSVDDRLVSIRRRDAEVASAWEYHYRLDNAPVESVFLYWPGGYEWTK